MAEHIRRQEPELVESLMTEVASTPSESSPAEGSGKQEKDQDSHN